MKKLHVGRILYHRCIVILNSTVALNTFSHSLDTVSRMRHVALKRDVKYTHWAHIVKLFANSLPLLCLYEVKSCPTSSNVDNQFKVSPVQFHHVLPNLAVKWRDVCVKHSVQMYRIVLLQVVISPQIIVLVFCRFLNTYTCYQ